MECALGAQSARAGQTIGAQQSQLSPRLAPFTHRDDHDEQRGEWIGPPTSDCVRPEANKHRSGQACTQHVLATLACRRGGPKRPALPSPSPMRAGGIVASVTTHNPMPIHSVSPPEPAASAREESSRYRLGCETPARRRTRDQSQRLEACGVDPLTTALGIAALSWLRSRCERTHRQCCGGLVAWALTSQRVGSGPWSGRSPGATQWISRGAQDAGEGVLVSRRRGLLPSWCGCRRCSPGWWSLRTPRPCSAHD